jgi:hypothetical protein
VYFEQISNHEKLTAAVNLKVELDVLISNYYLAGILVEVT